MTAAAVRGVQVLADRNPGGPPRAEAERCLVAYAVHALRGEITLQRTLAEVALADPRAGTASLREMGERVVAATERQDRLLEALLTLSRSECGRVRGEPGDLG